MEISALEQFMRPNIRFFLWLTVVGGLLSLFALFMGLGSGDLKSILTGLLVFAGCALLFYGQVYFELKVYRDKLRQYESSGELEALAAEFQGASECFNRGRLRLGSGHIFVRGECEACPYGDILAVFVDTDDGASLYARRKGQEFPFFFRSVKWRRKDDPEIREAVSAIQAHNPAIEAFINQK